MPITQHHAELVGRSIVERFGRYRTGDSELYRNDHVVTEALWRATMEGMERLSGAAADETLLDVKYTYSFKVRRLSVEVTLLVATDQRLWIVRHDDGRAAEPLPVPYEAVRAVGKMSARSVEVQQEAGGVTIIGSRGTAKWLRSLQLQRPTQPAAWLATSQL